MWQLSCIKKFWIRSQKTSLDIFDQINMSVERWNHRIKLVTFEGKKRSLAKWYYIHYYFPIRLHQFVFWKFALEENVSMMQNRMSGPIQAIALPRWEHQIQYFTVKFVLVRQWLDGVDNFYRMDEVLCWFATSYVEGWMPFTKLMFDLFCLESVVLYKQNNPAFCFEHQNVCSY